MKKGGAGLNRFVERVIEWIRLASPLEATQLGVHEEDHRVDDLGSMRQERAEQLGQIIRDIPRFDDPEDRIDAAALRAHLSEIILTEYEFNLPGRAAGFMAEQFLSALFHQVNGSYAPAAERFGALLYRLRELQRMLGQNLIALNVSASRGIVPAAWTLHGMEVAEDGSRYLLALRRMLPRWLAAGALRRAVAEELTRAARAFLEYRNDIKKKIYPKSGPRAHAAGHGIFEKILADVHLLAENPADFLKEANEEADEIRNRLAAISLKLAGTENWREANRTFSLDHPTAARLIETYRKEVERLEKFVRNKRLSSLKGAGTLKVIETPSFERASIPYAAYQGPAPFESRDRQGYFFVTPPDRQASKKERIAHLRESPLAAICITAAHEGFPGHHLQHLASHAAERPVRRMVWNAFFGEGWAHYAETWVFREGFPADERTEFFLLKDRLWRCVRVGLDLQIHLRRMPLAQAAKILAREAGLSPGGAHGEIVRYSLEPTQPMSYFVGRKFFERLIEDERRRQGGYFDTAETHDRILSFGAVPISLVRKRLLGRL